MGLTTRLDAILIGRFLGERALGLYTVAFRVPELAIQAVAWQLSLVILPSLSRKRVVDEGGLPRATERLIRLQAVYVLPVAAGISVLSVPVIGILFGPAWREATSVLVPVSMLSAMFGVAFPLGDLLKATGRQGVLVALNVLSIPLLVGVMIAMTSRGLAAVAWGRVGTTAFFVVGLLAATSRLAGVSPRRVVLALGPGCMAALGVLLGAGGVRLLWDDISVPAAFTAAAAGAAGAAALVMLCAPATWAEIRSLVPSPGRVRRRRPPAAVAARIYGTVQVRGKTELAARALDASGLGALILRSRPWRGVLVLTYHRIAPDRPHVSGPGVWSATPAAFAEHVRFLAERCEVIGADELEARLGSRRCSVLITFDDGYRDCAEHALPVLRAHGLPAAFFLTTGFLDRTAAAWWDEIAWMVEARCRAR